MFVQVDIYDGDTFDFQMLLPDIFEEGVGQTLIDTYPEERIELYHFGDEVERFTAGVREPILHIDTLRLGLELFQVRDRSGVCHKRQVIL